MGKVMSFRGKDAALVMPVLRAIEVRRVAKTKTKTKTPATTTWYRVRTELWGVAEIHEIEVIRTTAKMLVIHRPVFDTEQKEAITTTWYETFPTRDEAVRCVERALSKRVTQARRYQKAAVEDERLALTALDAWRKQERLT